MTQHNIMQHNITLHKDSTSLFTSGLAWRSRTTDFAVGVVAREAEELSFCVKEPSFCTFPFCDAYGVFVRTGVTLFVVSFKESPSPFNRNISSVTVDCIIIIKLRE